MHGMDQLDRLPRSLAKERVICYININIININIVDKTMRPHCDDVRRCSSPRYSRILSALSTSELCCLKELFAHSSFP